MLFRSVRPDGFEYERRTVECKALSRILDEHGQGREIDFVSIDVEGAEGEVIRSADLGATRPTVLVVESVAPLTFEPTHEDWEPVLLDAGYLFAAFDGLNRFYVDAAYGEIISVLAYPVSVLDQFVTEAVHATQAAFDDTLRSLDEVHRSRTWRAGRMVATAAAPALAVKRRVPRRRKGG